MTPQVLKAIARTGYAARGMVYFIVGGLAVIGALGEGGGAESTKGALLEVMDSGVGTIALFAIAAGLFCYAAWRALQSLADADDHGASAKGLIVRASLLLSAITHTVLGVWALSVVISGHRGEGDGGDGATAWLMQQPYGPWLVGLVGLCIVGAGIAHIVKGAGKRFEKWFDAQERAMKLIRPVSITGLIARGIVFVITGGLFIYAGLTFDPDKAGGIREALQWLRGLPVGSLIFLTIAVGLVCFGAYSMLESVYRRIKITESPGRSLQGAA